MRLITAILLAALLTLTFAPGPASASSIGVYFAADGSDCDAEVPSFTQVTWYILAVLGGDPFANGITGAEFRQTNTPTQWFVTATPNPAAIMSIGNPLGAGANIGFPSCQQGDSNGVLLLYTVTGFAAMPAPPTTLSIVAHAMPSNPAFNCPNLVGCDAEHRCVPGGEAFINRGVCSCCPAVEPSNWTRLKSLYGD